MSTYAEPLEDGEATTLQVNLPRRLLVLPPTAWFIGTVIGMSRGGSRARLRFLAENAHRQPTTVQGWYFYTKTRNYRILFGALKQGSKDGAVLGAATAFYVLTEEGVAKARKAAVGEEQLEKLGQSGSMLRQLQWVDGGIAGGLLGGVIGGFGRFPTPLLLRTVLLGTTFGALEGLLRIAQGEIGKLREKAAEAEEAPADKPT